MSGMGSLLTNIHISSHEIPLRIMSAPEPLSEDEFQSVRTELYESVYHYVCEE